MSLAYGPVMHPHTSAATASAMMIGVVLTPSTGYVVAAAIAGVFSIITVWTNAWYQKRRAPVLESVVVAAMAVDALHKDETIETQSAEIKRLRNEITGVRAENIALHTALKVTPALPNA